MSRRNFLSDVGDVLIGISALVFGITAAATFSAGIFVLMFLRCILAALVYPPLFNAIALAVGSHMHVTWWIGALIGFVPVLNTIPFMIASIAIAYFYGVSF